MIQKGDVVTLFGLLREDLNGKIGTVMQLHVKPGRHCLRIGKKRFSIKEINMRKEGQSTSQVFFHYEVLQLFRSELFKKRKDMGQQF